MKKFQMLAAACALSMAAVAGPITWSVNLTLSDGGTATGTFTFNADSTTACTTTNSPCGTYSNINIVTTNGSALTGITYNTVCGFGGDTSCTGVTPDSTEVEFLTSNAANQTGLRGIALFFLAPGPVPPSGLSDAGGSFDMSGAAGIAQESFCVDAACSSPTGNSRISTAGTVATPEPSTALLLSTPLAMFGLARLLKRRA